MVASTRGSLRPELTREERQKRGVGPYDRLTVARYGLAATRRYLDFGRLAPSAAQNLGNTRLEYPDLPHRPRLQPSRRARQQPSQNAGLAPRLGPRQPRDRVQPPAADLGQDGLFSQRLFRRQVAPISGSCPAAICWTRMKSPTTAPCPTTPSPCWYRRAGQCSSTAGSGTRPVPTSLLLPARCSSTGTPIAGSAPATTRPSNTFLSALIRSAVSYWGYAPTGGYGYTSPTDEGRSTARLSAPTSRGRSRRLMRALVTRRHRLCRRSLGPAPSSLAARKSGCWRGPLVKLRRWRP